MDASSTDDLGEMVTIPSLPEITDCQGLGTYVPNRSGRNCRSPVRAAVASGNDAFADLKTQFLDETGSALAQTFGERRLRNAVAG